MGYEKECEHCGTDFTATNSNGKYCSARCRSLHWKARNLPQRKEARTITISCRGCGNDFRTSNHRKMYCTKECRWEHLNALRPTTQHDTRECPACGREFQPRQSRGVGKTYCSAKCKRWVSYQARRVKVDIDHVSIDQQKRYDGNWILALKRDDFTCQLCGVRIHPSEWSRKKGHRLVVHHKDMTGAKRAKNHSLGNLIVYCVNCHELYHSISLAFIDGKWYVEGAIFKKLGMSEIRVAEEAEETV